MTTRIIDVQVTPSHTEPKFANLLAFSDLFEKRRLGEQLLPVLSQRITMASVAQGGAQSITLACGDKRERDSVTCRTDEEHRMTGEAVRSFDVVNGLWIAQTYRLGKFDKTIDALLYKMIDGERVVFATYNRARNCMVIQDDTPTGNAVIDNAIWHIGKGGRVHITRTGKMDAVAFRPNEYDLHVTTFSPRWKMLQESIGKGDMGGTQDVIIPFGDRELLLTTPVDSLINRANQSTTSLFGVPIPDNIGESLLEQIKLIRA